MKKDFPLIKIKNKIMKNSALLKVIIEDKESIIYIKF